MKKLLLSFSFAALTLAGTAQTSLYQNVKKLISEIHPEISTENKLIAFNVWSIEDPDSREANKSFEKAYTVYEHARLKGGSKGIIVIAVNKNNLTSEAVITFAKDGIIRMIPVKWTELEGIGQGLNNCVFDSSGNEVYKNLSAQNVFSSINHLITR